MRSELESALAEIPILDIHTHLVGGKLAARGLHDVFLYHMVVSDLYAAGCPIGARLTQFPSWPSQDEAHARIKEALPSLKHIQNTSSFWGVRIILARPLRLERADRRRQLAEARRADTGTGRRPGVGALGPRPARDRAHRDRAGATGGRRG